MDFVTLNKQTFVQLFIFKPSVDYSVLEPESSPPVSTIFTFDELFQQLNYTAQRVCVLCSLLILIFVPTVHRHTVYCTVSVWQYFAAVCGLCIHIMCLYSLMCVFVASKWILYNIEYSLPLHVSTVCSLYLWMCSNSFSVLCSWQDGGCPVWTRMGWQWPHLHHATATC